MKTIFEELGGTYTQQGDYLLPDIKPPDQTEYEIGVWGQRRRQYLKQHHRVKYYNMLTQCTLYPHLAEIEQQANKMFTLMVNQLVEKEGVTEKLKTENTILWVRKMNNIRNYVIEVVNSELIYSESLKDL